LKCAFPAGQIALFVEGDLRESARRAAERHLRVCQDCRELAGELRESQQILKSLRREAVCPSEVRTVRERVLGEIGAVEASLGWVLRIERRVFAGVRRRYALAGVAGALASTVVLGVAWLSGGDSAPGVERIAAARLPEARDVVLYAPSGVVVLAPRLAPAVLPTRLDEPTPAGRAQPDAPVYSPEVQFPALGWNDLPLMAAFPEPPPASVTLEVLPPVELSDREPDQVLVKMLTDDPSIVIYWMVDQDDPNEGGA
jgi:hypothetical protein